MKAWPMELTGSPSVQLKTKMSKLLPLVRFMTKCLKFGVIQSDVVFRLLRHDEGFLSMDWKFLEWNSTLPEIWDCVVDKVNEQSGAVGKFIFDNIVLPVGQSLLYHVELAVQYSLNGEYEVFNILFIFKPIRYLGNVLLFKTKNKIQCFNLALICFSCMLFKDVINSHWLQTSDHHGLI